MDENAGQKLVVHDFERVSLEKLRLAARVILDEAAGLDIVSDPLEVELGIFKDRVEFLLLLPEAAAELPRRGDHDAGGS